MKQKVLNKITGFNLAKHGVQTLYVKDSEATPAELTALFQTADHNLKSVTFHNCALPEHWGAVQSLDAVAVYTNAKSLSLTNFFNISIKKFTLQAHALTNFPGSIFNNNSLLSLIINCQAVQTTDATEFNLPQLLDLTMTSPSFDFSAFRTGNLCSNLNRLNLTIKSLNKIPSFFRSRAIKNVGIFSEEMTAFPLDFLENSEGMQYLNLATPIAGLIPAFRTSLENLTINSSANFHFDSSAVYPIKKFLYLKGKDLKQLPRLSSDKRNTLMLEGFIIDEDNRTSLAEISTHTLQFRGCQGIDYNFLSTLHNIDRLMLQNCDLEPFAYYELKEKLNLNFIEHKEEEIVLRDIQQFAKDKKPKKYTGHPVSLSKIRLPDPTVLVNKKNIALSEFHILKPDNRPDLSEKNISLLLLGKEIAKATGMTQEQKERLFLWFWQHGGTLVLPDNFKDNLHLLSVNYLDIKQEVKEKIVQPLFDNAAKLKPGLHLFINGNPDMAKTELTQKAETAQLTLHRKPAKKITHMVLCNKPHFTDFAPEDYTIISEDTLRQFLYDEAPGFLIEEEIDPQLIENITQFLNSPDSANLLLGFGMIQSGGLPQSLFEKVLVIAKTHEDGKVRRAAGKVMKTYGPEHLVNIVKTTQTFKKKGVGMPPTNRFKALEKKLSVREIFELNFILFKHDIRNLRYMLCHRNPDFEVLERALRWAYERDGKLNFGKLLGNFYKHSNKYSAKFFMHPDFPAGDFVEHLDLSYCGLRKFPAEALRFKNLKTLTLNSNFIQTIPKSVTELEKLEHISLYDNSFNKFPEILRKISGLRWSGV